MKPNLSSKLILVFFLVSLVVILFPTITKGSMSFVSNPTCGSHYGLISCDKYGCNLSYRGACLPWQTGEGKVYCGEEGCEFVFLGCNLNISCAKPPTNLRYYDNPNYPTSPFLPEESISANNIFLPVKLDWDDVEGWKDGWVDDKAKEHFQECRGYGGSPAQCAEQYLKTCLSVYDAEGALIKIGVCEEKCNEIGKTSLLSCGDNCDAEPTPITCQRMGYLCDAWSWRNKCKSECPEKCKNSINFYQIRIDGGLRDPQSLEEITEYKSFVDKSEFIPPSCLLKSNQSYQWQVRACVEENEQKCGPWSELETFTTNLAPEHVSPYDPDWAGDQSAENISPVLDWCPVENTGSYFLEIYREDPKTLGARELLLPQRIIAPSSLYDDDIGWQEIKKGFSYWWHVLWCPERDTPIENCGPFSQFWGLVSGQGLLMATNLSPKDGTAVNLSTILSWLGSRSAAAYWVNVQGDNLDKNFQVPRVEEGKAELPLKEIWEENLKFNTIYHWQVAVCSKTECGDWSKIITLRTTGAPPTNIKFEPKSETGKVGFPLAVSWDDMPGVASYAFEIPEIGLSKTLSDPKIVLDFTPSFQQGKTYAVSIKTCADEQGEICGKPATTSFTVATLDPLVVTQPEQEKTEFISSISVRSEEVFGANAYQYQLLYVAANPKETAECKAKVGSRTEKIISNSSGVLSVFCAGQYSLQARGCMEPTCLVEQGQGRWSGSLTFEIQDKPGGAGLIPCGQSAHGNNPWDARDPCQIKHLFLLVKIIIDFLLLRVIPIIVVLLTITTGIIFYTSLGEIITMARVISLWKAAGVGLGIVFFAWTLVNIFLKLIGYNIGIFGNWYQIPL